MPSLLVSSWMWHLTRWNGLFLGTYLVTHLGGPPIANQFVGVAMFAPMLAGAYFSSRSDIEPRTMVFVTELVLLPVSVLMTVLVSTGAVSMWMIYPFELAYGFGGMVNMTAQRELLFRLAGPDRATRVLNIEVTSMAAAMMLGPLLGGLTISVFGLGVAFGVPAALLAGSVLLFWTSTRRYAPPRLAAVPVRQGTDWRLLSRSPALTLILLVTVICNLCYFAFLPLVPVIAEHLDAGAAMAGVIGAAAGIAQLVVGSALVMRPVRRPLAAYVGGVALCLGCLGIVAATPLLSVTLVALGIAGIGQALFGSAQATLPVAAVGIHERAAALGLLSTTIGLALPTGMVILGVTSSVLGPQRAMLVSALVGLLTLAATLVVGRRYLNRPTLGEPAGRGGEGDSVAA
ncbi:putative MFS family arabinose efflux permease [Mycolicibacterium sp. BK634]|uniref:MFS transporter n=1 Tax=Mycobacteriaceae TaxID=1762 RepID=UPI00105C8DC6|nr:MFS transporter [Mycobacterium sp. BK086]MBB3752831.1 putative MFS family arabinose efflux permease [Mycolicibacterium sp. BK634]